MNEAPDLPARERGYLDAYAACELGDDDDARAIGWARLADAIDDEEPFVGNRPVEVERPVHRPWRRVAIGVSVAVAAAVLVTLGWRMTGSVADRLHDAPGGEQAAQHVSEASGFGGYASDTDANSAAGSTPDRGQARARRAVSPGTTPIPEAVAPSEAPPPRVTPPPPPPPPSRPAGVRVSKTVPSGGADQTAPRHPAPIRMDLDPRDVELVAEARGRARAGQVERARRLLDEHRAAFPRSVLAAEREAEALLLACADADGAMARKRFLATHPPRHLIARVGRVCPQRSERRRGHAESEDGNRPGSTPN